MNKSYLNPEFEKLPNKRMFVWSLIISAIVISLGLVSQIILPPQIPLFYNLPQTEIQLSKSFFIILPSLISIIITAINAFVAIKIQDSFLKKTLAFTSISVCILATVTTLKIIFLVGSI